VAELGTLITNRLSRGRLCGLHHVASGERGNDLTGSHDRTSVIRKINVESGVHHLFRVIRRRVPDHSDVVAEFGGIADCRFDAGMRNQSYDYKLEFDVPGPLSPRPFGTAVVALHRRHVQRDKRPFQCL
jgi:hypothetical protein